MPELKDATDHRLSIYNLLDEPGLKFIHDQYRLLSIRAAHANLFSSVWEPTPEDLDALSVDMAELLGFCGPIWTHVLSGKSLRD